MDGSTVAIIQAILAAVVGSVAAVATIRVEIKYMRRDINALMRRVFDHEHRDQSEKH